MLVDPFSIRHKIGRHLDMLSRLGRNQAWTALSFCWRFCSSYSNIYCACSNVDK